MPKQQCQLLVCGGSRTATWWKHTIQVFLDLEGGSPNATLVVLLVGISSLKITKAFLIRTTQCSATKLCIQIRAHIPYRSTVSDF